MPKERSRTEYSPPPRRKVISHSSGVLRRGLGWMLGAVTLVSFIAIPLAFSQGFSLWQEVPTNNPFGVTPSLVVTNQTPTEVTVSFVTDVGRQDPTNIYGRHICDPLVLNVDPNGPPRLIARLPDNNNCVAANDLALTAGACCAGEQGRTETGQTHWAGTAAGNDLTEYLIAATPPYALTPVAIDASANLISATLQRWAGGWVATAYDLTTGMVNIYVRSDTGAWIFLASQTCDSPATNYHWDVAAGEESNKLILACNNGGTVTTHQYSLDTGDLDWSTPVDTVGSSPDFYYQQVDLCGLVNFGDGSTGEAAAILSPSPAGIEILMMGPVGTSSAPTFFAGYSSPGAAPDRQVFVCDGSMIYNHGASPDGFGALTRVVNCGHVDGPCIGRETEDNSRDVDYAGVYPGEVQYLPTSTPAAPIDYDRLPIVEGDDSSGEGVDVVRYGALTVPLFFDSFESGDLGMWDTAIGGAERPGGAPGSEDPDRR